MKQAVRIVILPILLLTISASAGEFSFAEPNWAREEALEAAASVDTAGELKWLFELAREGRDRQLLQALSDIEARAGWPLPARERLLHAFTTGLADLDPAAVGANVLQRLESYEPRTRVPHEEQPGVGVALFNIPAAASGVRARWERQLAALHSASLLVEGADRWLTAYKRAGALQRQGMLDGLAEAANAPLRELAAAALENLPSRAVLTDVATRSGLLLNDATLFGKAVAAGSGAGLTQAIRTASDQFSDHQNLAILTYSIEHAPRSTAALTLATLAPVRLREPEIAQLVFETLENPELGSAAALVLAGSDDNGIRQRLRDRAERDDSLAARRAAVAMRVQRTPAAGDEP
jgi:hypothetical protein